MKVKMEAVIIIQKCTIHKTILQSSHIIVSNYKLHSDYDTTEDINKINIALFQTKQLCIQQNTSDPRKATINYPRGHTPTLILEKTTVKLPS